MIQQVLSNPQWQQLLQAEDLRGLTPLIVAHINLDGTFQLASKAAKVGTGCVV